MSGSYFLPGRSKDGYRSCHKSSKMAKVKDNILTKGFSGTIGKQLTFRQIGGKTFVSKYQKAPTVPATEKKLAVQAKFGMATAYARRVVRDQEVKAMYQAVVTGCLLY